MIGIGPGLASGGLASPGIIAIAAGLRHRTWHPGSGRLRRHHPSSGIRAASSSLLSATGRHRIIWRSHFSSVRLQHGISRIGHHVHRRSGHRSSPPPGLASGVCLAAWAVIVRASPSRASRQFAAALICQRRRRLIHQACRRSSIIASAAPHRFNKFNNQSITIATSLSGITIITPLAIGQHCGRRGRL